MQQHITLKEAKAASLLAHQEGRLLAQSKFSQYAYEYRGSVCAIGASLNRDTLEAIKEDDSGTYVIQKVRDSDMPGIDGYISFAEDERAELYELQRSHDEWFNKVLEGCQTISIEAAEQRFVALLGEPVL